MSAEQTSLDEIVAWCLPTLRFLTSRRIKKRGEIPRRFVVLDFLDSLGLVLGRMAHAEFDFPNPEELMGSTRREIGSEVPQIQLAPRRRRKPLLVPATTSTEKAAPTPKTATTRSAARARKGR